MCMTIRMKMTMKMTITQYREMYRSHLYRSSPWLFLRDNRTFRYSVKPNPKRRGTAWNTKPKGIYFQVTGLVHTIIRAQTVGKKTWRKITKVHTHPGHGGKLCVAWVSALIFVEIM